jgi:predicted flap endonuclease-1-like 5' DNA nuclease
MNDLSTPPDFDLPRIGKPATRALVAAGIATLEQVSRLSEAQLLAMHGVGPKAVRILRDTLAARGLSFAS